MPPHMLEGLKWGTRRNATTRRPKERQAISSAQTKLGFTLAEMSVVLIVIGLVIMAVFPTLSVLRASSQRAATQSHLDTLMRAAAVYAQANGCLPCPTPANISNTAPAGFGRVRGDATASPAPCGACATPEGIPPFMSLGIPASAAHDGSSHWITMRVDPALANPAGLVAPPTAPAICVCAYNASTNSCASTTPGCSCVAPAGGQCAQPFNASVRGLCAPNLSKANAISIRTPGGSSQLAALVFVSHNPNGAGSLIAEMIPSLNNGKRIPSQPACSATSGFANCNADGDINFVDAPKTRGSNDPFEDTLAYANRNELVGMLSNGAACQSSW